MKSSPAKAEIRYYINRMRPKKTSHAVYDTRYHLVWAAKYRKWILRGDIKDRVESIFKEIAANHDFEIDEDHIHIFLSFPPMYSISKCSRYA